MERFLNALKGAAGAMDRSTAQPRFGIVTSVDPTRPAVRVTLQPEAVLTGWLPVLSPWVGAGWGISCPPSPGDQVLVLAQEGDSEHGIVVGRAWSDNAHAPQAPSGELWLVHRTGSFIKLANDGTIRIQGDVHHTGNLFVTGNITAQQTIQGVAAIEDGTGTLDRLRQHYDAHTHVDSRGGTVSLTSQPD